MALLNLFFDVQTKRLVFSETNGRSIQLPDLHREDNFSIDFRALQRINSITTPLFKRVILTGYSLVISIGSADNPLAQASSWSLSDGDTLMSGTLNMSTAGINALADGSAQTFEIKLSTGGLPYRGQQSVTIRKSVATSGALSAVINDVALGILEAQRTYMPMIGQPGQGFTMVSADGLKKIIRYLDNDGSIREEQIT